MMLQTNGIPSSKRWYEAPHDFQPAPLRGLRPTSRLPTIPMKLLMISGDRSLASGKQGAFFAMLQEFSKQWERVDVICPACASEAPAGKPTSPEVSAVKPSFYPEAGGGIVILENVFVHHSHRGLLFQPQWIRDKGAELVNLYHHNVMTVHEYPPFYNGIGARMLKSRVKIPTVLEIHHIVGWPKAASLSEWIGRILSKLFLAGHAAHFDAVRTVNSTVKNLLCDWGVNPALVHVVPSFYLDKALLKPDPLVTKKYDIVFAARLTDNKGLMSLLGALIALPTTNLLVIGDGPLRKKAERFVRDHALTHRVTFAGWLPTSTDVVNAMQSGKIFVMPSLSEGGPRSALEAMACGLPLIATRVGVMPDVISDSVNGIFTDGSAYDLAEKIRMLLGDEQKQKAMGMEAAKIIEKFEKTAAIKKYADFLQSIAASRSQPQPQP